MLTLANGVHYASTPSGWVTGVVVPLACVYLAWKLPRSTGKRASELTALRREIQDVRSDTKEQNKVLTATAQGLAIVVEDIPRMRDALTIAESNITVMDRARIRLEEQVKAHDNWSRERYQEMRRNR